MTYRGVPRRFQCLLLLVSALTILIFLNTVPQNSPNNALLNHPYFRFNFSAEEPVVDVNQLCLIPRIHPFDPSIWRYIGESRPISCKVRFPALTYIDDYGWLSVNETALKESGYRFYDVSFLNTLTCQWRVVLRGGSTQTGDDTVDYGVERPLTQDGASVSQFEVVTVTCKNFAGVPVYENVHANIRDIALKSHGQSADEVRKNVLIFGLDSMSRQAFIRLLPKTYRYLTHTISMQVYTGMNKIGDNTFPNLIALLTGKPAYESDMKDIPDFDDWPLIWKNYSRSGYVTLWAEDFPDYGLFNYLDKGFKNPPVHHYLRPFWLAVKNSATLRTSSHMCFGNTPRHQLQLDYLLRFILKYTNARESYFAFSFLGELSHEYISRVGAADEDLESFFKNLFERSSLDNTLLIVMSDHGHRFDPVRLTQVGHLEERLPFFAIHLPKSLVNNHPHILQNLRSNRGRLTTPYDIHSTLMDFLSFASKGSFQHTYHKNEHGRTLFQPIAINRTCPDAGIPPHYCICKPETPISIDDLKVRSAVRVLFNRVNKMLRIVREFCAELIPGEVYNAQVINTEDNKGTKNRIRISVSALPSDAIFEATMEVRVRDMTKRTKSSSLYDVKVLGDVSRINMYGNQSFCIKHDILRKYCYCHKRTMTPSGDLRSYQERRRAKGH